jgi:hypothetical protein
MFKANGNGYGRQTANGWRRPNNRTFFFVEPVKTDYGKSNDRGSTWAKISSVKAPFETMKVSDLFFSIKPLFRWSHQGSI